MRTLSPRPVIERMLTVPEVAIRLGVSALVVRRLAETGALTAARVSRRGDLRFWPSAVDDYRHGGPRSHALVPMMAVVDRPPATEQTADPPAPPTPSGADGPRADGRRAGDYVVFRDRDDLLAYLSIRTRGTA